MKNLLTLVLVLAASSTVAAEPRTVNKSVICDDKIAVFRVIGEDFKELPVWQGFNPIQRTELVLTVNPLNGAWTMIEYRDDWACIIAVGERSSSAWGTPA